MLTFVFNAAPTLRTRASLNIYYVLTPIHNPQDCIHGLIKFLGSVCVHVVAGPGYPVHLHIRSRSKFTNFVPTGRIHPGSVAVDEGDGGGGVELGIDPFQQGSLCPCYRDLKIVESIFPTAERRQK